jgi:hypothetical protein
LASSVPNLVYGERKSGSDPIYFFKLCRYLQLSRTFAQFEATLRKALKGYAKHVAKNAVDFITNNLTFLLIFHFFACAYIKVGTVFKDDEDSWYAQRIETNKAEGLPPHLNDVDIYVSSIYFIISTATTVGYGDFYATHWAERVLLILV